MNNTNLEKYKTLYIKGNFFDDACKTTFWTSWLFAEMSVICMLLDKQLQSWVGVLGIGLFAFFIIELIVLTSIFSWLSGKFWSQIPKQEYDVVYQNVELDKYRKKL